MRNKVTKIIAIVIILIFGGTYMYNKLTKPNLGPKTAKLYQHGFRLLEEQIGTYIKEHYRGIEKIGIFPNIRYRGRVNILKCVCPSNYL